MLCPKCGYYAEKDENVCPECGEIVHTGSEASYGGAEAIRQGKRARQAIHEAAERTIEAKRRRRSGASRATVEMPVLKDEREEDETFPDYRVSEAEIAGLDSEDGAVFERRRRTVYDENEALEEQARAYTEWIEKGGGKRLQTINWMKIAFVVIVAAAMIMTGTWLFLTKTGAGQKVMARMGREATSTALWAVGEDQMDSGDVEGAIISFEKAKQQDTAENHVDVDGLLMLGSAYEAAGRTNDAAKLYEEIYTGTPSRPEAYVNHIRILLSSGKDGDLAKAGDLMKTAYENTGESSFQTQRRDLLPAMPEISNKKLAGFYEYKIKIELTSYQGYDIYYTFDDEATLPEGGIRYTDGIEIDERPGGWNLRAVAVNGELVSDELRGSYKIVMPSPQMPQCNLAPGTYKTRQKVKLRPGKDNEHDDDIRIFYTIDGSIPDENSPEYTGEPILLPSGHKVTIRAAAINRYQKWSQVQEVSFKIEAKPYPLKAWEITETIAGLELNKTTMQDFQAAYGEGEPGEVDQKKYKGFEKELRQIDYPWGYAVMNLAKRNWVLVGLCFRDKTIFQAPRGTGIGDPLDFVVGKFRDLGQPEGANGKIRGLYQLENMSDGKILNNKPSAGEKTIRYRIRNDGTWLQLEYRVSEAGTVREIEYYYIPN